jgi:hypothetical protein
MASPSPSRRIALIILTACLSGALAGAADAQVYLHGQSDPFDGEVQSLGPQGVVVRAGQGTKTISWDRIREVRGDHGAEAAKFAPLADQVWRARTRLERGDFASAEPLLDGLVDRARAEPGPTAVVVFEGLVRCRLKRGAQLPAVWAWLDWIRARGGTLEKGVADAWIGARIDGPAEIDEDTGLVTALPPVFLRDAGLDAGAASEEWARATSSADSETAADLAMLYRAAARFEAGLPPELRPVKSEATAVRLVGEIVRARVGDDGERKQARDALLTRLGTKDIEPWMECWCRVGIGRSLVREQDPELRRQGVIQMLHVPARFIRVSPQLAALALAESAVTLHEMGDEAGAASVKGELIDRFSRSAAAGWPRLREVHVQGEAAAASGGTTPQKAEKPGSSPESTPTDGRPR